LTIAFPVGIFVNGFEEAYNSGAYTMADIAEHFGVHYMTVSRAVRGFEGETRGEMFEC
jgi:transposase